MNVIFKQPSGRVSDHVERILVIEHQGLTSPFCLPLFANGTPTLLFQTVKGHIKGTENYLTLFGQTITPENLVLHSDFTLIAYFLKPYALTSLFGIAAHELTDKPVDLNLVMNDRSLQEALLNAGTTDEMIALLDAKLFAWSSKNKTDNRLIRFITQKIIEAPSTTILTDIQKETGITERSLQRLFAGSVGVSPVQFRKITQFQKAFQQLNRRHFNDLADVAFENGYADQSHYGRVFREFTHLSPKEYLRLTTQI